MVWFEATPLKGKENPTCHLNKQARDADPEDYAYVKERIDGFNKRVNMDLALFVAQVKRSIYGKAGFEVHIMKNVAATAALNLAAADPVTLISNWTIVIGVLGVLFYFTFMTCIWRRGGRPLELFTTLGQYILFAAFGSMWGNMMLFRCMLGVGRVLEILKAFGMA